MDHRTGDKRPRARRGKKTKTVFDGQGATVAQVHPPIAEGRVVKRGHDNKSKRSGASVDVLSGAKEHSTNLTTSHSPTQKLEDEAALYSDWIANFEQTTGVEAQDAADEVMNLRQQVDNAKGIEVALRAQITNHKKQAERMEKEVAKVTKQLAKCQETHEKDKAKLWREKNIYNTSSASQRKGFTK